jgi:hypothetical protein
MKKRDIKEDPEVYTCEKFPHPVFTREKLR